MIGSDILKSRLSFGTVFLGERFEHMSIPDGADLLLYAHQRGITSWDTSEDYGTHEHVAHALRLLPRDQVVISTKLNLPNHPLDHLLEELGTDYIDILFVHGVEVDHLDEARAALIRWQKEKARGRIRAAGISTHSALVAEQVYRWPEVEVMMLPINMTGDLIPGQEIEGGMDRMKSAAQSANAARRMIIAMKVLGFGVLANRPREAIEHVASLPYVDTLVIGMKNKAEIDQNIKFLGL
jgi:uncharacterized protein